MQTPGSGSLDQVLRFLALMAQSAAYALEVSTYLAERNPTSTGVLRYAVNDANGNSALLDLVDNDFKDLSWVSPTIQRVQITDALRIEPPFPRMLLTGQPGSIVDDYGEAFRSDQTGLDSTGHMYPQITGYNFEIDCIIITVNGSPEAAIREALIHTECFDRLIARNRYLGGLVRVIDSHGPGVPASTAYQKGTAGAGHLRLTAQSFRSI